MFKISNNKIQMVENDFGIILPISLKTEESETILSTDSFRFNIYNDTNKDLIISKTYTVDSKDNIYFVLTKEESLMLPVGIYKYDLDWLRNNEFLNNIIKNECFIVAEKAGTQNES